MLSGVISKAILSRPIQFFMQWRHYGGGIRKYKRTTYYPRQNHVEPPITPTKILMVQRVKPYSGNPYWDKKILDQLGLDKKQSAIALVKNIPENCKRLWQIKHLLKITSVNLPDNLPDDDSKSTVLHENGDLLLTSRIDPARERATKEFINDVKRLDRHTLTAELRMRWLNPYDL